VRDCRHQNAYLFGAICPARAVGAAIVMPRVSSEAMTLHLEEISKAVGKTAHAMLVCDGAGWHRPGGRLTVPENITLLRFPPYAPELNPMENVWEYLRGNQLGMTVWRTYTAILDACCHAWNGLMKDTKRITSITTQPGHRSESRAIGITSAYPTAQRPTPCNMLTVAAARGA
jgi:hypothetical protein